MARGRFRTVTDPNPPLIPGERPRPPADLNAAQRAAWLEITGRLPQGWFPAETHPLLKLLVAHISYADEIAADIAAMRSEIAAAASPEARRLQRLLFAMLRAHGLQSERIASLSGKLRLTQRSRYTRDAEAAAIAARNAGNSPEPWVDWDSDHREQ
jgi:hypothetical protein